MVWSMLSFWLLLSRGDTLQATRRQRPQHEAWPRWGRDEGQDQNEDVDDGTGNCFSMQIHIIRRQSVATTTAIVVDTPTPPPLANEIIFSICISFFYGFAFEKNFTDRCFTVFYFLSFCFHVSHFLCVFYFIYCAAHRLLPATVIDTHRSGLMNVVETFN